jgi:hypothetical protein
MKKIMLVAAVATFALGLGSCKKDYTCNCSYTSGSTTVTSSSTIKNAKKKDAESACTAMQSNGSSCVLQ